MTKISQKHSSIAPDKMNIRTSDQLSITLIILKMIKLLNHFNTDPKNGFANNVDPDETAMSRLIWICTVCLKFLFCHCTICHFFGFCLRDIPFWVNGLVQIHRQNSPLQKVRGERIKAAAFYVLSLTYVDVAYMFTTYQWFPVLF